MKRYSSIVLLVLLAFAVALPTAEAQKKKKKKSTTTEEIKPATKVKASAEGLEKWVRVKNKDYRFAFAHPEEWVANILEHPDPDVAIPDDTVDLNKNDFNAIEVNREEFESGAPYILVYAIPKQHQSFDEYFTRLNNDLGLMAAKVIGADSTSTFKGFPMYDVTYDVEQYQAKVRSIVIYANGLRYGIMYTAFDNNIGNAFRKHMPRFERLLETLEIGEITD